MAARQKPIIIPGSGQLETSPLRRSVWATLVYLIAGFTWITVSDQMVARWFSQPEAVSSMQTGKGYLFVLVTGLVLFLVLLRQLLKDRMLLSLQSEQRQALRQREQQLTILMNNLPGMAYRCLNDRHWTMKFVSAGCEDLTGYRPDELLDNRVVSYASLLIGDSACGIFGEVSAAVARGEPFSVEYPLRRKDGGEIWVWERGCAVDDDDHGQALEGIVLDISDRKKLERKLQELATRDPLTGLLNRREFTQVLADELERARRYRHPLGLLWVDFDHFKNINDRWGHAAGDTVLCAVSKRLQEAVRSVDFVGRFGGEEFVIALLEMEQAEALATAERLRQRVAGEPIVLESGKEITVTISIGVAVYPAHGQSMEELAAMADKAMYRAKSRGRDCVVLAQPPATIPNEAD